MYSHITRVRLMCWKKIIDLRIIFYFGRSNIFCLKNGDRIK
jgi:hypothetical protein